MLLFNVSAECFQWFLLVFMAGLWFVSQLLVSLTRLCVCVCWCRCFSQGAQQLLSAAWSQTSPLPLVRLSCFSIPHSQNPAPCRMSIHSISPPLDLPAVAKAHTHTQISHKYLSVVMQISLLPKCWFCSRLNHHVPDWSSVCLCSFVLMLNWPSAE